MADPSVTIVIPAFNEETRLEPRLSESINFLKSNFNEVFEIIFVNDGSSDKTLEILYETKAKFPESWIHIISYPKNEGKGFAVKTGVLRSRGRNIVITDADFSVDLTELPNFISGLEEYDVVIGSKKHFLTDTRRSQKAPRRFLGKGFTWLSNFMLGLKFTDITCGFRGFRAAAAKVLFSRQLMKRWSYDAEILFLAKKFNYKIQEKPVKWHHVEGSKVSPIWDAFRSLRDLFFIIFNNYCGKYN